MILKTSLFFVFFVLMKFLLFLFLLWQYYYYYIVPGTWWIRASALLPTSFVRVPDEYQIGWLAATSEARVFVCRWQRHEMKPSKGNRKVNVFSWCLFLDKGTNKLWYRLPVRPLFCTKFQKSWIIRKLDLSLQLWNR